MKKAQDENEGMNGERIPGSVLDKLPRKSFFTAPEGYFEKLPLKVQERIHRGKQPSWVELIRLLLKPAVSVPALLIVVVAGYFAYSNLQQGEEETIADVSKPLYKKENPVLLPDTSSVVKEDHEEEKPPVIKSEREPAYTAVVFELSREEELMIAAIPVSDKVDYLLDQDIDIHMVMEEL